MPTKKKTTKKATAPKAVKQFLWKGVPQVGDVRLYGKNPGAYYTQVHVPVNAVGPGDIVDDIEPSQRYTFYLFEPERTTDSARELDRMRRAGYFKCAAPRFISPTEKFETRDGVLVLGSGIWYALPEARMNANRIAARKDTGALAIAEKHAALANSEVEPGFTTVAQTRADSRGQRKEAE